jgi:hypothetical protein
MLKPERLLRLFQIACVVSILLWIWIIEHIPQHIDGKGTVFGRWFLVLFAFYALVVRFWAPKLLSCASISPKRSARLQTPLVRWALGHIVRLTSALAICYSALFLHMLGGTAWLVYCIFSVGLALLLIWRSGASPMQIRS